MSFAFYNLSEKNMDFETVFQKMLHFIEQDPDNMYKLAIGTDSQVHETKTRFTSAIHLHRIGKGAWGCLRNVHVPRKVLSLREKISTEISLSQEIALLFDDERIQKLSTPLLPFHEKGTAGLSVEIHIDIGKKGETREFIQETISRIQAMGLEAKIKPDSYAASSYADKYTK